MGVFGSWEDRERVLLMRGYKPILGEVCDEGAGYPAAVGNERQGL
jgi:hypothetical protein